MWDALWEVNTDLYTRDLQEITTAATVCLQQKSAPLVSER